MEKIKMFQDVLIELVNLNAPSGHEQQVGRYLKKNLEGQVDQVWIDKVGNVIAKINGSDPNRKVLAVMAHMDEISMVVERVDQFVKFKIVGWIDEKVLMGVPVIILSDQKGIPGVIRSTSAHASGSEQTDLWIDVGSRYEEVSIGDPIVFAPNARWLSDEKRILASKAIDDRVGCAILIELAKIIEKPLKNTIYLVGTVQEEVGSFGARYFASQVKPDYVISIDTAFAELTEMGRPLSLGGGPVVRRFEMAQPTTLYPASILFSSKTLSNALLTSAKELKLSVNVDVNRSTFTDTSRIYTLNPDIECCPFLIPRRYSHSPFEVVDTYDAVNAANILAKAVTLI